MLHHLLPGTLAVWFALLTFSGPAAGTPASAIAPGIRQGELILEYDPTVSQDTVRAWIASRGAEVLRFFRSSPHILVRFETDRSAGPEATLARGSDLTRPKFMGHAQPNIELDLFAGYEGPFRAGDQRYVNSDHLQHIGSFAAWEKTTGSQEVRVAVIDTGLDYNHPDLLPNTWLNPGETGPDGQGGQRATNGVDDDGNGFIDDFRGWDFGDRDNDPVDSFGHGTHVAGIIGASGANGSGTSGVAWHVSLIGLKIMNAGRSISLAAAVEAIDYAIDQRAHIINASWGTPANRMAEQDQVVLRAAVERARQNGILFVTASGNYYDDNDNADSATLPATYDLANIISVGALASISRSGSGQPVAPRFADYANKGRTTVHLAAPGTSIHSTWPGGTYRFQNGTSMAAPVVAGAAALIKAYYPDADGFEIRSRILENVDIPSEVDPAGIDYPVITRGRLNVDRALR